MNVLSLFDGVSCGRIALDRLGVKPTHYFASEIDKNAIKCSKANWSDITHIGDVTKVRYENGVLYTENGEYEVEIDLVLAGSPCFVSGTIIDTDKGHKPIEEITVGDYVLTHTNQYKKVLRTGGKISTQGLYLRAQGVIPTVTTPEHPYYVRSKDGKGNLTDPYWKEAGKLTKGDYIGININKASSNTFNLTEDECMLIGRYIADGHTRKDYRVGEGRPTDRHWQLIISVGKDKVQDFSTKYKMKHSFYKHTQGVFRAVFSNKRLVEFVEKHCGVDSYTKTFHKVLLDLPVELLRKVLEGYMDGDGCYTKGAYQATTVSKQLAVSLSQAINKVFNVGTTVSFFDRPKTTIIEGRVVNQADTYTVGFQKERKKQSKYHISNGIVWNPVREVSLSPGLVKVFNLEVEEDNSYTANSAIVHNCQGFSMTGKRLNFNDDRSRLFFEFLRIFNECKHPNIKFLLENVRMKNQWIDVISEYLGVNPTPINSKLVSAQNRPRYYWTNIPHTVPEDKGIMLKDILEDVGVSNTVFHFKPSVRGLVVEQYEDIKSSKSVIHQLKFEGRSGYQDKQIGITKSPCITTTGFTLVLDASNNVRLCTITDLERLQTVPDGYTSMLPKTRARHALGNGWTVAVIEHILSHLFPDKETSTNP